MSEISGDLIRQLRALLLGMSMPYSVGTRKGVLTPVAALLKANCKKYVFYSKEAECECLIPWNLCPCGERRPDGIEVFYKDVANGSTKARLAG
jgi:hypothetical protein